MTNERETTVTGTRRDGYHIWTNDPVHIRGFDKRVENGQARVHRRYVDAVQYFVEAEHYDPIKGFKRARPLLSDAERAARGERLRNARKSS